ncbi:MAG: recombination protein RecR [Ruminococcaceae bacterium]|nr:recombination protein RecR [Oscillospiraceae bacterium]
MRYSVAALEKLINQFERLPSIGHKTAQRLAFHVLGMNDAQVKEFTDTITAAHENIHQCAVCCNLTEEEICPICKSDTRDRSTICVVEDPRDVTVFEKTGDYDGLYHVLHGAISPMNDVGPDAIRIKELLARLNGQDKEVKEIIMATNPTVEGEATAMYISKLLKPLGFKVTRLAYGIPVGADLEYADEVTVSRALEGRNEL